MRATQDFTRHRLKTDGLSSVQDAEWFHDVFRRDVARLDFEPYADAPFSFETSIRALPDLVVSRTAMSPMVARRKKQTVPDDAFMLTFIVAGEATLMRDGGETPMPKGTATYSRYNAEDSDGAFGMRAGATILGVRLSRRVFEPLVSGYDNLQRRIVPSGSEASRLLVAYLDALEREDAIAAPEARRLVVDHLSELAALVVGASREGVERGGRGLGAARLAAIKGHVLDNLGNPELSVATAAVQQGVTPRYVHMLFAAEGTTFSEFVVGQRLMRAHRMLRSPRFAGRTISAVALAVGFGDLSYFNRCFRRRFGMTPSEVRASARE